MELDWNQEAETQALDHILDPYSILDALRAWLHKKFSNNGWICTEYAASITNKCGFTFPNDVETPQDFVAFLTSNKKEFVPLELT